MFDRQKYLVCKLPLFYIIKFKQLELSMIKNLSQINKYLKDPYSLLLRELCKHPRLFNDEQYIRIKYRFRMGKKLNLDNPTTYNEKLQWLKLYNHIPDYTIMVDKIAVKSFISNIIGGNI